MEYSLKTRRQCRRACADLRVSNSPVPKQCAKRYIWTCKHFLFKSIIISAVKTIITINGFDSTNYNLKLNTKYIFPC